MATEIEAQHTASDSRSAEPAFLTIQGLRKTYGSVTAADITRLEARRGQLLTLLGPSGCGKTTTLRCIAGPRRGRCRRDRGRRPRHHRAADPPPQPRDGLSELRDLPAHDRLRQRRLRAAQSRTLQRAAIRARVAEALDLVELTGFEGRYRHQLSGGQQQRVALARAVAYQPDVLLLDEPFSNLDAKLRKSMRLQVRKLQQRLRLTTVFVTHDQQEALSLSDVVAVINDGKLEQVGTPAEVYQRPARNSSPTSSARRTSFRAWFAATSRRAASAEVLVEGGAILSVAHDRPLAAGTPVKVLCKPEQLRLTRRASCAASFRPSAYLGSVIQYQVELGGCSLEVVAPAEKVRSHGASARQVAPRRPRGPAGG